MINLDLLSRKPRRKMLYIYIFIHIQNTPQVRGFTLGFTLTGGKPYFNAPTRPRSCLVNVFLSKSTLGISAFRLLRACRNYTFSILFDRIMSHFSSVLCLRVLLESGDLQLISLDSPCSPFSSRSEPDIDFTKSAGHDGRSISDPCGPGDPKTTGA